MTWSLFGLFDAAVEICLGWLIARSFYELACWTVLPADARLSVAEWLPLYVTQDLFFYLCHAGYHHVGPLRQFPSVPRLMLPLHSNHHGPQSMFAYFSNLLLESPVFFAVCSAAAFAVAGWRGVASSCVQQVVTNYFVHIFFHVIHGGHHMRHHAYKNCNFGSECSLWDLAFDTYDGTLLFGTRVHDQFKRKRKSAEAGLLLKMHEHARARPARAASTLGEKISA
jgi:hypothetical protein